MNVRRLHRVRPSIFRIRTARASCSSIGCEVAQRFLSRLRHPPPGDGEPIAQNMALKGIFRGCKLYIGVFPGRYCRLCRWWILNSTDGRGTVEPTWETGTRCGRSFGMPDALHHAATPPQVSSPCLFQAIGYFQRLTTKPICWGPKVIGRQTLCALEEAGQRLRSRARGGARAAHPADGGQSGRSRTLYRRFRGDCRGRGPC